MGYHRTDVVAHAHDLLDTHGLGALTMRRLGSDLGVQPSAIYHHFANKQSLLAAVAEEILRRGRRPRQSAAEDWPERVRETCAERRCNRHLHNGTRDRDPANTQQFPD